MPKFPFKFFGKGESQRLLRHSPKKIHPILLIDSNVLFLPDQNDPSKYALNSDIMDYVETFKSDHPGDKVTISIFQSLDEKRKEHLRDLVSKLRLEATGIDKANLQSHEKDFMMKCSTVNTTENSTDAQYMALWEKCMTKKNSSNTVISSNQNILELAKEKNCSVLECSPEGIISEQNNSSLAYK